jgi:hypothetical protein
MNDKYNTYFRFHHPNQAPSRSKVVGCVPFPRAEKHSNIFHKKSQAVGSLALAKLTQQLADVNGDWEPDWGDENESKYCIYRSSDEYKVFCSDAKLINNNFS